MTGDHNVLRVETLGPLRVHADGRELALGPPRQRVLFAVLALNADNVVGRDDLIDHIWGDAPPTTAAGSLHTYVSGLRRALAGLGEPLTRSGSGYVLRLGPDAVDAARVKRLADRARNLRRAAGPEAALAVVDGALACWRPGPALSGLPGPFADRHRVWAADQQIRLVRERAELLLELARPDDVPDLLGAHLAAHPFDERLRALLMTALHRAGRTADALHEYRVIRQRLAKELGIDPSVELQALHRSMLTAEDPAPPAVPPVAPPARGTVRPAQLPRSVARFVGRAAEVRTVLASARPGSGPDGASPAVVMVVGVGGMGKTSLAVRCGHLLSPHFPDGQLFLDLRGFDPQHPAMSSGDALNYLLTAVGVRDVPDDPTHRAALWRSTVRDRRLLLVLDNARSADQVADLLPGDGPSAVLVTSRNRLGGLAVRYAARRVTLAPLAMTESLELLGDVIGRDRVAAQAADAERLAELCDHLPLALRIAAEQVTAGSRSEVGDLVAKLEDVQQRLDALQIPDDRLYSVRAVLSLSYDGLDAEAARAFRLIGSFCGASITAEAAAALLDVPSGAARSALQRLAAQHLLDEVDGRYRMHDLTRAYADEVARSNETDDSRRAALVRVLRWYLRTLVPESRLAEMPVPFTVEAAGHPPLPLADQAEELAWFGREWENIGPLIRAAHDAGVHERAWQLAFRCFDFFYAAGRSREWADTLRLGIRSAEALGARRAKALLLNHLSVAHSRMGENDVAVRCLELGLTLLDDHGDEVLRASLLGNLGSTLREAGQYAGALAYAAQALELARRSGHDYYEAGCLDVLCQLHAERGEFTAALRHGADGLVVARRCGDRLLEANILINLGVAEAGLSRTAAAHERFEEALTVSRGSGDRYHEALAVFGLAGRHRAEGAEERAVQLAGQALHLLEDLGAEEVADVAAFLRGEPATSHTGTHAAAPVDGLGDVRTRIEVTADPDVRHSATPR